MITADQVTNLRQRVNTLVGLRKIEQKKLAQARVEYEEALKQSHDLEQTQSLLKALLQYALDRDIRPIEDFVNYGISKVFTDRDLYFSIRHKEVASGIEYQFWLKEGTRDEVIADNVGGSVIQLISFLLRVLTILRLDLVPFIVLDEFFTGVDADYRGNLIMLLQELCHQFNFDILLITHITDFSANSDMILRAYSSKRGFKVRVEVPTKHEGKDVVPV